MHVSPWSKHFTSPSSLFVFVTKNLLCSLPHIPPALPTAVKAALLKYKSHHSTSTLSAAAASSSSFFFFLLSFVFLGPYPWHMEVPRLGVQSELQLPTCTTATRNPSCLCDLHHSSWQCRILSLLSKARDRIRVLMDVSQVH